MNTTFRSLSRQRTEVAVILLGIGLASAFSWTAVSYLVRQLFEPLPVMQIERLVHLSGLANVEAGDPVRWWSRMTSLEALATYRSGTISLEDGAEPVRIQAAAVSAGFFRTLGAGLAFGRSFTEEEDVQAATVAVLSSSLAAKIYQDPRDAVGKTLRLAGVPIEVIGVAPTGFSFPAAARIWLPRSSAASQRFELSAPDSGFGRMPTLGWVGRIRGGHSIESVRGESSVLLAYLTTQVSPRTAVRYGESISVTPFREFLLGRTRRFLWLILLVACSVPFIASLNVSLIFLGIALKRQTEFSTRAALGATRAQLFRQALGESTMAGVISGVAGVSFGLLVARVLRTGFPMSESIYDLSHSLIKGALLVAMLLVPAVSVLAGLIPSVWVATSARATLRAPAHAPGLSGGRKWLGGLLLAVQVCLAFCLVTTADASIRSALNFTYRDTGFDASRVLTGALAFGRSLRTNGPSSDHENPSETDDSRAALASRQQALLTGLNQLPGVEAGAFSDKLPNVSSGVSKLYLWGGAYSTGAFSFHVSPGYFKVMRIPLLRGRDFTFTDRESVIISKSLARQFFGERDPIGKPVRLDGEEFERQVIAVVGEVQVLPFGDEVEPQVYLPYAAAYRLRSISAGHLTLRCAVDCADIRSSVRTFAEQVAGTSCCYDWAEFSGLAARTGSPLIARGSFFAAAAALTLLILFCGVFAVVYHQASARAAEVGVHSVAGARPVDIVFLLMRDVLIAAGVGVVSGAALSLVVGKLLGALAPNVSSYDPGSFLRTAILLLAAVGVSGLVPALHMARRSPARSLGSL